MSDKKHISGYDILKAKYAELQAENKQLQATINQQAERITMLSNALNDSESARLASDVEHDRETEEMLQHMGWWHRLTWFWDHPEEE